ncbi:MAG: helix-hairpin-helix domain-containing protein, partial [Clostridia bacterium]
SKTNGVDRLLFGLGIRNIGIAGAKALAARFRDMEEIAGADPGRFEEIDDFGAIMARSLHQFFSNPDNRKVVERLRQAGVNMVSKEDVSREPGILQGMTFVLTGKLPTLKREEAQKLIEDRKGTISSSVSKNTRYLLAGEEAGSKLDKALELGIPVIDEETFLGMIEG